MELLGDVGHAESRLFLFGDSVSASARKVHGLCWTYHRLRSIWTQLMVPLGDEAQVEARFGPFVESAYLDAR